MPWFVHPNCIILAACLTFADIGRTACCQLGSHCDSAPGDRLSLSLTLAPAPCTRALSRPGERTASFGVEHECRKSIVHARRLWVFTSTASHAIRQRAASFASTVPNSRYNRCPRPRSFAVAAVHVCRFPSVYLNGYSTRSCFTRKTTPCKRSARTLKTCSPGLAWKGLGRLVLV